MNQRDLNSFRDFLQLIVADTLPPTTFKLTYGKLHPHPAGQTEFPTFQHENNKIFNKNYTFALS